MRVRNGTDILIVDRIDGKSLPRTKTERDGKQDIEYA